ncbi:MAG: DUF1292 domain-containing protein [Firmicutes bacterium]|nr:DUF1292 domain-containing protein [Bacillota bacterium]
MVEAFEIDHKKYVLLEPVEDPEFGAIIFAVETDEHGEEILRPIDDDDEFDAVSKAIEEILNED